MDIKLKNKILITSISLLLSLILLVGASFAWFSISQSPEISGMQVTLFTDQAVLVSVSGEEGTFVQCISLGEKLKYFAPLKPVSTADGKHWFIPKYDQDGKLSDIDSFILDDEREYANQLVWKPKMNEKGEVETDAEGNTVYEEQLTGEAYDKANEKGYYVYCTFYLMTELDEGCDVTLSVPSNPGGLEDWEQKQAAYGTYALGNYEIKEGNLATIDFNAQTALRVGFLMEEKTVGEGESAVTYPERFVIYEPNADKRSSITNKPFPDSGAGSNYVLDYQLIEDPSAGENEIKYLNYAADMYIPTRPIGFGTKEVTNPETGETETITVRQPVDINPENLIVQMAGEWNAENLKEAIANDKDPDSGDISLFGSFVKSTQTLYEKCLAEGANGVHKFGREIPMDVASETLVVSLRPNEPQEVTMFIWIEGQDPDCWNDIASGSFVINLEFAAQN